MKKILAALLAAVIPTVCLATVVVTKSSSGRLFDNNQVQYMPGVGLHSSNVFIPLKLDADGTVQTTTSDSAISLVSTQTVSPSQSAVYINTGDGVNVKAAPLMGITSGSAFVPILVDGSGKMIVSSSGGGGTISGVTAGTGLTGGGVSGAVTLNVDVGTTASKIVQLNGSAELPAVSGALLTNLPAPSGARLYKELTYDFSVQGGAISTLNLSGGQIPANSLILSFRAHKLTNMSTGNGLAFKAGAVNIDPFSIISTPAALNISKGVDTMQDGVVAVTSATSITMQIFGATLTAGKVRFIVEYVPFTP